MYTANKRYKSEELSSFSYPNLKLTAPTVLLSATEDVTIVASNIQQFRFLFQTQNKVSQTVQSCTGKKAEACAGGSFEINQAQLMLQLLNKRQSWGTSL